MLRALKHSIKKSHNSPAGLNEIHYDFHKKLTEESLKFLLKIFNKIWTEGNFPDMETNHNSTNSQTKTDSSDPQNYRPIPLTTCFCKTIERMINNRLIWHLESNNLISNLQCGLWSKKGTIDHLICLKTSIREAFIKSERLIAIFFNLVNAYDIWNR